MRWGACALSQLILPQWIVRPLNLDEFIGFLFVYIRFSRLYLERIRNAWILSGARTRTRPLQHIADSFALASVQLGKVSMSIAWLINRFRLHEMRVSMSMLVRTCVIYSNVHNKKNDNFFFFPFRWWFCFFGALAVFSLWLNFSLERIFFCSSSMSKHVCC